MLFLLILITYCCTEEKWQKLGSTLNSLKRSAHFFLFQIMASSLRPASQSERTPLLTTSRTGPAKNVHTAERNAENAEVDALADPQQLPKTQRNLILAAIWLGVFLGSLDTTIVASLVSSISSDFAASNQAGSLGMNKQHNGALCQLTRSITLQAQATC